MNREKQIIKEMAKDLCKNTVCGLDEWNDCSLREGYCVRCVNLAENLYNAGYRKQKQGYWKVIKDYPSYICSVCGAVFYEDVREWNGCPKCLSAMKGGAE